jgi:6-pyruvoyltetrahydropterin/6-carboxytetrahydropterin synthase
VVELTRTVRFCLNGPQGNGGAVPGRHNTFSSYPAMRGLGRYYELHVRCRGEADEATGYFINIKHIDAAVRKTVLPYLDSLIAGEPHSADVAMGSVMRTVIAQLQPPLNNTVVEASLNLTPMHSLAIESHAMDHILIRQQFEFSAAHRLHVPQYSDERNREIFGKCNNPSGHGHNYRLEVVARAAIDPRGHVCNVEALDQLVDDVVIQKLDHKHLNVDVPQFATLNPSVENIAKVIHAMLRPALPKLAMELKEVSVWETGKTVCTYAG